MFFYVRHMTIVVSSLLLATPSYSQDVQKALCSDGMAPMLQMVAAMETFPETLDDLYAAMNSKEKERFLPAITSGKELSASATAFRKAFLTACFE
jgi:Tfp pilus assembly protein PilE